MAEKECIQVIVPLNLEWEPYYSLPEGVSVSIGDRVRVVLAGREYLAVVSAVGVAVPEKVRIHDIKAVDEAQPKIAESELEFWRAVADYYLCPVGDVYKAAFPSTIRPARVKKTDEIEDIAPGEEPIVLTSLQEAAAAKIRESFSNGKTALLSGVTGSGKTEIYLTLAREAISKGRSVLFLVPEIALSRQIEERVLQKIPGVLTCHSGITPAQRRKVAARVRAGGTYMVLGTRSALFLPHRNLGLIIVDEEHDTSYKQDSPAPRYNARETAIMLAKIHGANVLLGSATPSLESLYNARAGIFTEVLLPERYHGGQDSNVVIIDTSAERRKRGMVGDISLKLADRICAALEDGAQVLVLRSRRSWAPSLQCEACGSILKCPRCNVPLSLHRGGRLVCHYCGHTAVYDEHCPSCGGTLIPLGAGTQKIEEELVSMFPQARVARLDADVPDAEEKAVVQEFAAGNIDILVGTQMVTKGFDFSAVRLVAVIQADNMLAAQDFRADERALQVLQQFRGRAGRRTETGDLVIQTAEPGHPVFKQLSGNGSDIEDEFLAQRRLFGYPPYTRIVALTLRDVNLKRIEYMAQALFVALPRNASVSVFGPYAPAVDKVAGEYIRCIRLMLRRDKALVPTKKLISKTVSDFSKTMKYTGHITVDVDPV